MKREIEVERKWRRREVIKALSVSVAKAYFKFPHRDKKTTLRRIVIAIVLLQQNPPSHTHTHTHTHNDKLHFRGITGAPPLGIWKRELNFLYLMEHLSVGARRLGMRGDERGEEERRRRRRRRREERWRREKKRQRWDRDAKSLRRCKKRGDDEETPGWPIGGGQ